MTYDESSLTLTATDNSGQPNRTATVTLTSETLTATIVVTQRLPVYTDYLGSWTLAGMNNGSQFTYNLTIEQATANSTYNVAGWGKSVMGASAEYAIRANFDVASGLIYITAQEDIAVYVDTDDTPFNVMFYGQIEMGGSVYYVGGSGYICYIGMLQRDGSVQWMNGLVTLQGGAQYEVVGGKYYIESQIDGSMLSFNADTPFMREPVMTKVGASARTRSFMQIGKGMTIETSKLRAQ